jgi:hypothetical protein
MNAMDDLVRGICFATMCLFACETWIDHTQKSTFNGALMHIHPQTDHATLRPVQTIPKKTIYYEHFDPVTILFYCDSLTQSGQILHSPKKWTVLSQCDTFSTYFLSAHPVT